MPLEIDDLEIKGDNPATHFWANGIVLTDEWNSRITNCLIKGLDDSTSPFDMGPGIHLIRCNDCRVLSNHIYHAEYGIRMLSDVPSYGDGALIQDNRIVGVTYGVYITGSNVVAQVGICYNHINANGACITLDSCSYTPIVGNLLFKTHTSTLNDWSCILLTGTSNDNAISGNNMSTPGAAAVASNFGIFIAGGFRNTITNNHFTNFTGTTNYPLYHGGGGGHTVATSNMCDTTMSATFNTGGGGTVDEANNKRA
jgi:nitrous oxidase accessory protein NosD